MSAAAEKLSHRVVSTRQRLAMVCVLLFLFVFAAVSKAYHKDVLVGFDELQHASYTAQIQRDGISISLDSLRLLDPRTFRFTGEANYLNHPPLYYFALGKLGPKLEGSPGAMLHFRLVNIVLAAVGLLACLMLGVGIFAERLSFYAYAIALFCIPVLPPLAGAINNDNAAFLGGALVLFGLARWLGGGRDSFLYLVLAGFVVAAWAKLTGLLLAGTVVATVLAYLAWRGRFRLAWIAAAAAAFLLAALPYAVFVVRYGSPVPDTAAQQMMLISGAHLAGWSANPRLSFPMYAVQFAGQFIAAWMPTLAPRGAFQFAMLVIPLAAVVMALAGLAVSGRKLMRGREEPLDILVLACGAALTVTLVFHVWFSYQRHLATGWMMDAYPRYYLPIIPFVPLAGLAAVSALSSDRWRKAALSFLIAGPIAFGVLGSGARPW